MRSSLVPRARSPGSYRCIPNVACIGQGFYVGDPCREDETRLVGENVLRTFVVGHYVVHRTGVAVVVNTFRTAAPVWAHTTWKLTALPPNWYCSPERVQRSILSRTRYFCQNSNETGVFDRISSRSFRKRKCSALSSAPFSCDHKNKMIASSRTRTNMAHFESFSQAHDDGDRSLPRSHILYSCR